MRVNEQKSDQRRYANGQKVYQKTVCIINHEGNKNENNNEISPHTHTQSRDQYILHTRTHIYTSNKYWHKYQSKRYPHIKLVEMSIGPIFWKTNIGHFQKIRN